MSKLFVAVDRAGNRRLYDGSRYPTWFIRLSLWLHRETAEPWVTLRAKIRNGT